MPDAQFLHYFANMKEFWLGWKHTYDTKGGYDPFVIPLM